MRLLLIQFPFNIDFNFVMFHFILELKIEMNFEKLLLIDFTTYLTKLIK